MATPTSMKAATRILLRALFCAPGVMFYESRQHSFELVDQGPYLGRKRCCMVEV